MTATPTMTPAEGIATTCHRVGYLIGRHHLPDPEETVVRARSVRVQLRDLHDLKRWAEATDATVVHGTVDHFHYASTVLGDVPVTMHCFGEALTP